MLALFLSITQIIRALLFPIVAHNKVEEHDDELKS